MSDDQDGVLRLVPRTERDRAQAEEYADSCHAVAVRALEEALAQVKAGHCHGVAVAMLLADGSYSTRFSSPYRGVDRMIGAAQTLVHRLLTETEP